MERPSFEVADVLRCHLDQYRLQRKVSAQQYRVAQAIIHCRTAALGGHVDACSDCGHWAISYNSCRNRHCPKCQWSAQQRWVRRRMEELLPVRYFHVVFTLPADLNALVAANEAVLYSLLFRTAWATLHQLARQARWLGAQPGMVAVLHTWGQNLSLHPHLHCIVPGGGLADDGATWVAARDGFFLPVRVLSRLFRGKFLGHLRELHRQGCLQFHGQAEPLEDPLKFRQLTAALYQTEWVVYAKRPFGGPQQVINYLGRYTHRIAISNRRILAVEDDKVTFAYKDYRQNGAKKVMTLHATEFIRRFLQHCLPPGFQKIRYYGILATRNKKTKLALLQQNLHYCPPSPEPAAETAHEKICPACGKPAMRHIGIIPAKHLCHRNPADLRLPQLRAPPTGGAQHLVQTLAPAL